MRRLLLALAAAAWLAGCGSDPAEDNQPPLGGDCAHAGGTLLGCDFGPIDSPEDACDKLLDCNAIALISDGYADRNDCLRYIGGLPDERQALALDCIEASSCDVLRGDLELCLEGGF
jgi:hypothetical protein